MTGPAHYREAEELLDLATKSGRSAEHRAEDIALAQVHATLALAAATAANIGNGLERNAWRSATGGAA